MGANPSAELGSRGILPAWLWASLKLLHTSPSSSGRQGRCGILVVGFFRNVSMRVVLSAVFDNGQEMAASGLLSLNCLLLRSAPVS
jgi:hypothetical protein